MLTQIAFPLPRSAALLGVSPHRFMGSSYRVAIDTVARPSFAGLLVQIEQLLAALRRAGRKSVEIVDARCGDGALLIAAAKRARALGFVAIEAKGFDDQPDRIEQAWARATATRDPAIGYTFMVLDAEGHLPVEDHDADIVLGDSTDAEITRIAALPAAVVTRPEPKALR